MIIGRVSLGDRTGTKRAMPSRSPEPAAGAEGKSDETAGKEGIARGFWDDALQGCDAHIHATRVVPVARLTVGAKVLNEEAKCRWGSEVQRERSQRVDARQRRCREKIRRKGRRTPRAQRAVQSVLIYRVPVDGVVKPERQLAPLPSQSSGVVFHGDQPPSLTPTRHSPARSETSTVFGGFDVAER